MSDTDKAETAQAVFCAMADKLGATRARKLMLDEATEKSGRGLSWETFPDFLNRKITPTMTGEQLINDAWKRTDTPGVSLDDVKKFLSTDKNHGWYKSSVLVAVELVENLANKVDRNFRISGPGYQNLYYFRTDPKVMNAIDELFKITNKNKISKKKGVTPFRDINKWSPADIYLASNKGERLIQGSLKKYRGKDYLTFPILNKFIYNMIDSGDLLPLSLKKVANKVDLYKVNFVRKKEEEMIASVEPKFIGTNKTTPYKKYTKRSPAALQLQVHLSGVPGAHIIKHDVTGNSIKAEYVPGGSARGGGVTGINSVSDVFKMIDNSFGSRLFTATQAGQKKFAELMKSERYKPVNKPPGKRAGQPIGKGGVLAYRTNKKGEWDKATGGKKQYTAEHRAFFDEERKYLSAVCVTNICLDMINTWFKQGTNASDWSKAFFELASSRTENSAAFVIAK